jgi:hypothetical protein
VNDSTRYLALAILVIIIGAFGTMAYYYGFVVVEEYTLAVDIEVIDNQKVEFNLDTDALHYGGVHQGSTQTRFVNITNNYDHDVTVRLQPDGELKLLLSMDYPQFTLAPDDQRQVAITLITPDKLGEYTGTVHVTLTK